MWLWRARFFKTRSLAADYIGRRGVRLTRNGSTRKVSKPGARILVGDVASFAPGTQIVSIRVLAYGTRRGPASEAQALYESVSEAEQESRNA
ncbi:RNA-binding S4 domain-containing protein [Henriciella litoralis]|uniref:RNA-binding S4 domain-containing protein n=1 Tax=Henriciella litoralis TaxID=568102 RepID=UPI001F465B97|nr:RNA-binding S4 domain-containing protein [Henriciella litoralis]